MREVRSAILVRENNTQLQRYSPDTRKLLYILLDFQVTERLHRGPEFSHNYLIDFIVDFIIDYNIIT